MNVSPKTITTWKLKKWFINSSKEEKHMKAIRFNTEQIIVVLKVPAAGMPVKELCWKNGMSDAPLYNWNAEFRGKAVSEARRLKELEQSNTV